VTPNDVVALLAVLGTLGSVLIFRGPLGRAIARRIEGSGGGTELDARLRDLEERVAQGEQDRAELIERLDFAERMLLQAREGVKELPR
jgi:hypothetical protein